MLDTRTEGKANLLLDNSSYIRYQGSHRKTYNPCATWYKWQSQKCGRDRLVKQNDKAYRKHVKRIPGLHELHIAEELHRFSELTVYYQDHESKVKIDPSIPPMGDPYNFHGGKWRGRKFDQMWDYWVQCYPAHAHDIEREIYESRQEERVEWWNLKNKSRRVIKKATSKRGRPDDEVGLPENQRKMIRTTPSREKGHFEAVYLSIPCKICGSHDHPALQERQDEYCDIKYHYVCPMAIEEDWETCFMRPCPIKMAILCDYNKYEILKSWHKMIYDGWGQHQTPRVLRLFLNMANKARNEVKG